jgi:hypothetical protein
MSLTLGRAKVLMERIDSNQGWCNTPDVCHHLSSGFELKHDRLSGEDDVKVNLWR